MALVLALGALGVGFAAWTDTVTVNGSVTTGDVNITVENYSGTYVWKTSTGDEIVIQQGWMSDIGTAPSDVVDAFPFDGDDPADDDPVASATSAASCDGVTVTFTNLFPSIWFKADALMHYTGSVPAKVNAINIDWLSGSSQLLQDLAASDGGILDGDIYALMYRTNADGTTHGDGVVVGDQLHYCDYIMVEFWVRIPQDNDYMLQSGSFETSLDLIQWNEGPPSP